MNIKSTVVAAFASVIIMGPVYFFYDHYFLNPDIQVTHLPEYYIEYKVADKQGNLMEGAWSHLKEVHDASREPEEPLLLKPEKLIKTDKLSETDKTVDTLKTVVWEYGIKLTDEVERKRFRDNLSAYSAVCIGVGKITPRKQLKESLNRCISLMAKQPKTAEFRRSFAAKAQNSENLLELAVNQDNHYPVFKVVDSQLKTLLPWIKKYSVAVLPEGSMKLQTTGLN
ncbi:hypothetical protein EOPP23_08020 [Endozoicomonas sp. OPT23]|nr:hypothetical protein [Endozoicomonas sp. OPT23]